ncbi:hypothetical protein ASZ90_015618 [hydrocarbon metagenome]|uniref:Uncharacterized protein n=1 Tax=hydrocarbon metagenome TaxID=938273 RepID=A0A0W8F1X5_9ZZZZ
MKRILVCLLAVALLCSAVQAYIITFDAPAELRAGVPIEVTGTTNFPDGTQFDLILYKAQFTTPAVIDRRMIIVDPGKNFSASFPTTNLEAGSYKIEIQFLKDPGSSLGSSSVIMRQVNLIDRSSEIVLKAPQNQTLGEALLIEGYIPNIGVATITLRVDGPKGFTIPDRHIRTTTTLAGKDGHFSEKIAVTEPGNYYVSVYDAKGFITQIRYSVTATPPVSTTPRPEETGTMEPRDEETPRIPATPTIPLAPFVIFGGLAAAAAVAARKK